MRLESNWKFTFDPDVAPRVILNFGDLIEGEPVWSLKKGLQVTQLDEAVAPFLRASGNAVVNFTIKVYAADVVSPALMDKTARQRVMESLIAVAPLAVAPLKVQVNGLTDRFWQFEDSYITEHTPQKDTEWEGQWKSYNVTATGLEQVGP
jgi:hypothetical protein